MFDANVVDKLISIEKKIFNSFQLLSVYSKSNIKKFNKELKFLKEVLLKKESILISKLPCDEDSTQLIMDIVFDNKNNFFDEEEEEYYVLERFSNILNNINAEYCETDYYDDEYELISTPLFRCMINNNIELSFVKQLSKDDFTEFDVLFNNIIFLSVYRCFYVSHLIIDNCFDISSVSALSHQQMINKTNLEEKDYYFLLDDVIYNKLESLMSDITTFMTKDEESAVLKHLLLKFKFLIRIISNDGLFLINELFERYFSHFKDNENVLFLSDLFVNEFKNRNMIIPEVNKSRKKIPNGIVNSLISLIKIEEEIYLKFFAVDFNNIDKSLLSEISSLLDREKYLNSKLCIDKSNSDIIKSMIEDDLNLFLLYSELDEKIISKRLFNVINYFYEDNALPFQSLDSYDNIFKKHIVNSLNNYLLFYNNTSDYLLYLKKIIFQNPFLTYDFVSTGNLSLFESLSDDIICDFIGSGELEYDFDKNEQLYDRASEIIDYMLNSEYVCDEEKCFLLCEIEDIKSSLSSEYIERFETYNIPSSFEDDDAFVKMVDELVRDKKSLKSIIKR